MSQRIQRRVVWGVGLASFLAIVAGDVVVLRASGDYNDNPPYCRSSTPLDPLWWYYECWKPDPPDWGKES